MPAPTVAGVPALSERSDSNGYWADLDGLRAFAILLVLGRHSLRPFITEDTYQAVVTVGPIDLTPLVLNGWIGVDLFFVLSGFLIGRQAWRGDSLRRFWFKRVTRIMPAYLACLGVVAIGLTIAGAWPKSSVDFLAHVVMLQDYTGSVFVPSFWSLGAEEKFYLLAPLLVFVLARPWTGSGQAHSTRVARSGQAHSTRVARSGQASMRVWQGAALLSLWLVPVIWRVAATSGLTGAVSYAEYFPQYRSPFHLTCESLVLGFAIAWMSRQTWSSRINRPLREALFWGGAAGVMIWLVPSVILLTIDARTIVLAPVLIGLCFGAMVFAAVSGPGSYSLVAGRGMWRPLATGSYTLYLTHMMVLPVAGALAMRIAPLGDDASITARWIAFLPWYLALTVLSAYVLHRYVERPMLQWRDRRLQVTAAAPPDPLLVRAA